MRVFRVNDIVEVIPVKKNNLRFASFIINMKIRSYKFRPKSFSIRFESYRWKLLAVHVTASDNFRCLCRTITIIVSNFNITRNKSVTFPPQSYQLPCLTTDEVLWHFSFIEGEILCAILRDYYCLTVINTQDFLQLSFPRLTLSVFTCSCNL